MSSYNPYWNGEYGFIVTFDDGERVWISANNARNAKTKAERKYGKEVIGIGRY